MVIGIVVLFILLPIISLPLVMLGYLYDTQRRQVYSLLFGIFMGIFAYYLVPPVSYDLTRHHQLIDSYAPFSWNNFLDELPDASEPVQSTISWLVSLTGNNDLLQFSIVSIGYAILLYVIGDFAKKYKINKLSLFTVLAFTLTSFTCTNFFSGLWNYIAMIIFTLAFYWDILCDKSRWKTYPLYALTPLIHSSMFFVLVLLIIFKIFKHQVNIRSLSVTTIVFLLPVVLLPVLQSLAHIPVFSQLLPMYNAYFVGGERFLRLYGGVVLVMEVIKLIPYNIVALTSKLQIKKNSEVESTRSFVILLMVATVALTLNGAVFLRFVLLIQFIGAFLMMASLNDKRSTLFIIITPTLWLLTLVFFAYQASILGDLDFSPLGIDSLLDPIWKIFTK